MPSDESVLNDPDRLAALRKLGVPDTAAEEALDRLVRLTSTMLDVPVALISLLEHDRQLVKSFVGLPEPWASRRELPLEYSFCQHALRSTEPLIIEDARKDPLTRSSPAVVESGSVAYVGVPLMSEGHVLGTFCVTDTQPRAWTPKDVRFVQEMAATALAHIELRAEIAERQQTLGLLRSEQKILELIGRGRPLATVLESLALEIENQTDGGVCTVLVLDRETNTLRLGAAPSFPEGFGPAIDGLKVQEGAGACGTAACRNEVVVLGSIQKDPVGNDFQALAREHHLAACWSHPIRASDGTVLGTVAVYDQRERQPMAHELKLLERAAHLAAIALERTTAEEARLAMEERYRRLVEVTPDAIIVESEERIVFVNPAAVQMFRAQAKEDLLGTTLLERVAPAERPAAEERLRRVTQHQAEMHLTEERLLQMDGAVRVAEIAAVATTYQGKPAVQVVARDLTERRAAEASKQETLVLLRAVLEGMTDPIFAKDGKGRYTVVNTAFAEMVGSTIEGVIGKTDDDFFEPEVAANMRSLEKRIFRTRQAETVSQWIRGANQEARFYVITKAPCCDRHGEVLGVLGIARDVTAQHHAELRLRESELSYRSLFDSLEELIYVLDLEGRILNVNGAMLRRYGYTREELIGRKSQDLIDPPNMNAEMLGEMWKETLEGRPQRFELNGRTKAGQIFPKEITFSMGHYFGAPAVFVVGRDISERRRAEQAIAAAEAHYRRLVETSPDGIFMIDNAGYITELNRSAMDILRANNDPADALGRHFSELIAPDDLPAVAEAFQARLSGHASPGAIEAHLRTSAGGEGRVVSIHSTLAEEDGETIGVHGIVRDVTETLARDQTMRLLIAALESFEDGVILSTSDLEILYANRAWARILGLAPEELRDLDVQVLLPDDAAREQFAEMHRTLAEEGYWSGRVWRRRADDGKVIPLDLTAGAVDSPGGERNLFFVVHEALEAIERENRLRRIERLASVGTLVGGVAHELNNPLHAIRNFAEMMLLDPRPPDDQESLEIVKRQADRAAKIVADLRRVAHETQAEKNERTDVHINDVVRHVLKLRRYSVETSNIEIREELHGDLPAVRANQGEIEQVLLNLVINAEQAMSGQERERVLIVRTTPAGDGIAIEVVDTGAGISPEDLPRIFDPFFTTKSPGEGTGLGLSLANTIITEHQGEIRVESQIGVGTTMQVRLPRATGQAASPPEESIAHSARRQLHILLVDDEEPVRHATSRLLEKIGHRVDTAAEGGEALRLIDSATYDVIISDLRMPGLSGEALLERLRAAGQGMERKLIFMTGDISPVKAAGASSSLGLPVLIKPVPLEKLVSAVDQVA